MTTEGCVLLATGKCKGNKGEPCPVTIRTPKKDEFIVVNHCGCCYNMIYEKDPVYREPEDLAKRPEIVFTFETADEIREVLEQWNFLL